MTFKHIEAFRIVMQTGSMTEASRRLHTSQPQISRLVSQLEEIVGFRLFERRGTRLEPLIDGKQFFQEVEKSFVGLVGLEVAASNIKTFSGDRLAVAAMPRIAGGLLTQAVSHFKRLHPATLVTIHSGAASTVNTWVSAGVCDVGLAVLYGDDVPGMRVETLLDMDCVAVLPKGHRLAAEPTILARDLDGEDFVSFPMGSSARERMDRVFAGSNARPRTVLESDLGASVCALVGAGFGIAVINPLAALEEREAQHLVVRPFVPRIAIRLALLLAPDAPQSRLVGAFTDSVREVIARAGLPHRS